MKRKYAASSSPSSSENASEATASNETDERPLLRQKLDELIPSGNTTPLPNFCQAMYTSALNSAVLIIPSCLHSIIVDYLGIPLVHCPTGNGYADQRYRILVRVTTGTETYSKQLLATHISDVLAKQQWIARGRLQAELLHPLFMIHRYSTHVWEVLVHGDEQCDANKETEQTSGLFDVHDTPSCQTIAIGLANACASYASEVAVSSTSAHWMAHRWLRCLSAHGNNRNGTWKRRTFAEQVEEYPLDLLDEQSGGDKHFEHEAYLLYERRKSGQDGGSDCYGMDSQILDGCPCWECERDSHAHCRDHPYTFETCPFLTYCTCTCRACADSKVLRWFSHEKARMMCTPHTCIRNQDIARGGFAEQLCFVPPPPQV